MDLLVFVNKKSFSDLGILFCCLLWEGGVETLISYRRGGEEGR